MGLSDRLKDLRKQAETAVSERKDQITGAVESVGAAANEKTKGKYADKIAKVGGKMTAAVDKIGGSEGAADASEQTPAAESQPADAGASASGTSTGSPEFE